MLRLFYLQMLATAAVSLVGCAGSARWRADSGDDAVQEAHKAKPRAGALASSGENSDSQEQSDEPKKNGGEGLKNQSQAEQPSQNSSHHDSHESFATQNGALREGRASQVNDGREAAGDTLAEQVQALGFDDPADSASALAALRAAPPQHRPFLLRTMQASAAVRRQHEARETADGHVSTTQQALAGQSPAASVNGHSTKAKSNRFAQMLANSSAATTAFDHAGHGATAAGPRRHDAADVDPNVVAEIEVEPADEPVGAVKPASYSESLQPAAENRVAPAPQPAVTAAPPAIEPWQAQLQSAIATLETKVASGKAAADRANLEARLRLLYLAADRRDDALQSRAGISADEQEFWSKEVYGLAALLDNRKQADAVQRAAVAAPHLREAAEQLGGISGLVVKNLHFCTEVKGYGTYLPFARDEFHAGQEVLLYCEVENFESKLIAEKGYHTALKARYEVFNESGSRVADKDLGLKEEHCQNRRRDFFVPYFLWTPKQVPPGKYQLKLTLEDVHGGKTAESTIEFVIKDK